MPLVEGRNPYVFGRDSHLLQVLAKYGPQTEAQIAARLEEMFPSAPPASTNVSVAPAPGITTVTVPR